MAADADIQQQIIKHLQAIPIFLRLTDEELGKIYSLCQFKRMSADELLYKFGAPSDDMFILLDGQLVARAPTGEDIAHISPIGLVGEMGVLTDQPRSADVICLDEVMGFHISKSSLIQLLLSDASICRKMLLNLVKILSQKLYDTNAEIEKLRRIQTRGASAEDNIFLY